jgi:cysteine-rich repeat protein
MTIHGTKLLACFGFLFGLGAVSGCDLYFGPDNTQPDAADAGYAYDCVRSHCGDGTRDSGERCDDGNQQSGDGCSSDCSSAEVCGNGIIDWERGEQCDDGNLTDGDGCESDCKTASSCVGEVTCATLPPTCTTEEVPLLANGCYTGACRLITACDVPPTCTALRAEAACLARTDCEAAYTGRNCQHPNGSACRAGDTQCVCESFTFAACATAN